MPIRKNWPPFLRFVVAGAINTAVTMLLFALLIRVLPHLLAYSITYVLGIVLSYALNTGFVFNSRRSWSTALRFPLVYAVQYLYGVLMMWLLIDKLALGPVLSLGIVIATSIPMTFVASRLILSPRPGEAADPVKSNVRG